MSGSILAIPAMFQQYSSNIPAIQVIPVIPAIPVIPVKKKNTEMKMKAKAKSREVKI
jgi:hypothetical protein